MTRLFPGAPDPCSGPVCSMTEDRIKPLVVKLLPTPNALKGLGKGSGEKLHPYF